MSIIISKSIKSIQFNEKSNWTKRKIRGERRHAENMLAQFLLIRTNWKSEEKSNMSVNIHVKRAMFRDNELATGHSVNKMFHFGCEYAWLFFYLALWIWLPVGLMRNSKKLSDFLVSFSTENLQFKFPFLYFTLKATPKHSWVKEWEKLKKKAEKKMLYVCMVLVI